MSSVGRSGVVASAHRLASEAGLKVLKRGGNAVDAVVATALSLGVVAPAFSGVGGGGFMLVHLGKQGKTLYIDYRETAPAKATRDMFKADADGEAVNLENSMGYRAVGVPGSIAGLTHAIENYGNLKFKDVASHAIEYAKRGFAISKILAYIMANNVDNSFEKFRRFGETGKTWLKDGRPLKAGKMMANKELASALELVTAEGADAFYHGKLGESLVNDMAKNGGLIRDSDLSHYELAERKPVTGTYRDYEVVAMPPPSLGGMAMVQLLNLFENLDLKGMGHNRPETIATMAKALGLVYGNLRKSVADPAFMEVPVERLSSKDFARKLWFGEGERGSAQDTTRKNWTTHMSVIDKERNVAAITESLECFFGSGVTIPGTGICLNDTMHDFDTQQGGINSIEPGKRPVSNMTPTLLLKDGEPFLVAGSAGGPRIVTATLQTILNVVEHGMDIPEAVNAPRMHYQGTGAIRIESRIPPGVRKKLDAMGYSTQVPNYSQLTPGYDLYFGGVHAALVGKRGELRGGADKRRQGHVAAY
ncbi:MAG: gamma-glutamyltransferase [Thaumarchaeota archaeon]|nr:gamma-glutamyltransferase [Nitrososphaerota archaeon]